MEKNNEFQPTTPDTQIKKDYQQKTRFERLLDELSSEHDRDNRTIDNQQRFDSLYNDALSFLNSSSHHKKSLDKEFAASGAVYDALLSGSNQLNKRLLRRLAQRERQRNSETPVDDILYRLTQPNNDATEKTSSEIGILTNLLIENAGLSPLEQVILFDVHWQNKSYKTIGVERQLSKNKIRQCLRSAYDKIYVLSQELKNETPL